MDVDEGVSSFLAPASAFLTTESGVVDELRDFGESLTSQEAMHAAVDIEYEL